MLSSQSREVLEKYQVRKSSGDKREFRAWLRSELEKAGWQTAEEGSFFSGHNVIAGDPDKARVFFTAHYDTQAVLPFPNFITPRSMGWYLLYNAVVCLGIYALVALAGGIALSLPLPEGVQSWTSMGVCIFLVWWLFFGKANRHTVNDNTSGVLTLLETALALPAGDRDQVCLVFFDNEERGMLGSSNFASRHKKAKAQGLILNFDCVSDGDHIHFFPTKRLKKEENVLKTLENIYKLNATSVQLGGRGMDKTDILSFETSIGKDGETVRKAGEEISADGQEIPGAGKGPAAAGREPSGAKRGPRKDVTVVRGFGFYPSDNASFKRACGVCSLNHSKLFGFYMDRIHTAKDTVMDEENIALLRSGNLALAKALREQEG